MIAVITMILDHFAKVLFPELRIFVVLGRISFLLFAFLLVEGYIHSKNSDKYLLRLILWTFISEVPFNLAFFNQLNYPYHQNIFFTLATGLISLKIIDSKIGSDLKFLFIVLLATVANICYFDYQYLGILEIVFLYIYRRHFIKKYSALAVLNIFQWGRISTQAAAILGFIPLYFYNGQQGRKVGKWFYSFYAVHLLLFYLIRTYILK